MSTDYLHPSVEEEIADASMGRPHVLILGAGASVAAFPHGERNGMLLPVMTDIVEILGLTDKFSRRELEWENKSFEDLYSELVGVPEHASLRVLIEERVYDYFSALRLPDTPTLYDHLVLSLRGKDVIATFNWDPFLADACIRNAPSAKLPHTLHLHGNVRIGTCEADQRAGLLSEPCPACGVPFKPTKLLYPVRRKDYTNDPFIRIQWQNLRSALRQAYMLTIFGYGAPASDLEVIALMTEAWGPPETRNLEEIEIVDIKPKEELARSWRSFIHTHHYKTYGSFYQSWIARHPRRTCEATWNQVMGCQFLDDNPIPREVDFPGLREWFRPLFRAEEK